MGYGNTKKDCIEPARKLAAHLTGLGLLEYGPKKWKVEIWENLGWHYAAISPCGRWKVHPHHKDSDVRKKVRSYSAFLGEKGRAGGYWSEIANSARAAIVNTAKKAYEDIVWRATFLDLPIPPRKFA
jgi:hypothetical protein